MEGVTLNLRRPRHPCRFCLTNDGFLISLVNEGLFGYVLAVEFPRLAH